MTGNIFPALSCVAWRWPRRHSCCCLRWHAPWVVREHSDLLPRDWLCQWIRILFSFDGSRVAASISGRETHKGENADFKALFKPWEVPLELEQYELLVCWAWVPLIKDKTVYLCICRMLSDVLISLAQTSYLAILDHSNHSAAICSYGLREDMGRKFHLPHSSVASAAREIMCCSFVLKSVILPSWAILTLRPIDLEAHGK